MAHELGHAVGLEDMLWDGSNPLPFDSIMSNEFPRIVLSMIELGNGGNTRIGPTSEDIISVEMIYDH